MAVGQGSVFVVVVVVVVVVGGRVMISVSVLVLVIVPVVVSVSVTVVVGPGMVMVPEPVGHVVMLGHRGQLGQLGQARLVVVGDGDALVVLLSHAVVVAVPNVGRVLGCTSVVTVMVLVGL